MAKASRKRNKERRMAEKRARKAANYAHVGPKASGVSKKKKPKTVGEGNTTVSSPTPKPKTSAKGRRRRRKNGLQWALRR